MEVTGNSCNFDLVVKLTVLLRLAIAAIAEAILKRISVLRTCYVI